MGGRARMRLLVAVVVVGLVAVVLPEPSGAAPAKVNGAGSTYVALAMQQWVADAQTNGLAVNYTPTGSPQGLTSYAQGQIDFAGTEAEFSALSAGTEPARGFQYVPDVAGAISVMYNVWDKAGRKVDYLNLSRRTIARIFTGDITTWADPAISADNPLDNGNLVLPDEPINVVYRGSQSGTTGLFYDFVAHVAPDIFGPWAARNQFPTDVRIIQLDSSPTFAPKTMALQGSDQIAQFIAGGAGKWSIGYDEFGYAKTYGAPSAWVENASGQWVQPYAENISEALRSAKLRPDLSQELSGVYNSPNPKAYPLSAYSYVVTQCEVSADRPTCKGKYANDGITETLARWLRYIACEGQVNMAKIGYSPLPPELSQEVANSIGRLQGTAPEILHAGNCVNPRFTGGLGTDAEAPPNPVRPSAADTQAGPVASTETGPVAFDETAPDAAAGGAVVDDTAESVVASSEVVPVGGKKSAGGGSGRWEDAAPVSYDRPLVETVPVLPLLAVLAAVLVLPPLALGIGHRRRRT